MTLTETLIILYITKTESNNCFIIHWMKKKMEFMFLLLHWQQATQSTSTWLDYPWSWVSLTDFENPLFAVWPIRKEIVSSMYNHISNWTEWSTIQGVMAQIISKSGRKGGLMILKFGGHEGRAFWNFQRQGVGGGVICSCCPWLGMDIFWNHPF